MQLRSAHDYFGGLLPYGAVRMASSESALTAARRCLRARAAVNTSESFAEMRAADRARGHQNETVRMRPGRSGDVRRSTLLQSQCLAACRFARCRGPQDRQIPGPHALAAPPSRPRKSAASRRRMENGASVIGFRCRGDGESRPGRGPCARHRLPSVRRSSRR